MNLRCIETLRIVPTHVGVNRPRRRGYAAAPNCPHACGGNRWEAPPRSTVSNCHQVRLQWPIVSKCYGLLDALVRHTYLAEPVGAEPPLLRGLQFGYDQGTTGGNLYSAARHARRHGGRSLRRRHVYRGQCRTSITPSRQGCIVNPPACVRLRPRKASLIKAPKNCLKATPASTSEGKCLCASTRAQAVPA